MKPRDLDIKELKQQDLRVRAYKDNAWNRNEGFEPFETFGLVGVAGASLALLALTSSIILVSKYHDQINSFMVWIDKSINDGILILSCLFS